MRKLPSIIHNRPRLFFTFFGALVLTFFLPQTWSLLTRALTGWNVAVWSYLILATWLIAHSTHEKVRVIAELEDESGITIVVILTIAVIWSLAAIGFELAQAKELTANLRVGHYLFTIVTVLGSWLLLGMVFTVHYANMFYLAESSARPLLFPDAKQPPAYWDFLYFAFTIAVAAQTSDITVLTTPMRKAVIAQSVLSFFFNAVIIGLSINIAAGLIGGK